MGTNTENQTRLMATEPITILHQESDTAETRVLYENIPKRIVTAFSTKWKAEFLNTAKTKSASVQKAPAKDSITVVSDKFDIHRDIVSWMLSCCESKGVRPFANPKYKPYSYLYFVHTCAAVLDCEYLEEDANKRMERIAQPQIHSEDVRALYLMNPADNKMRKFLVKHVAIRFWEKRLKAKSACWTLREEDPGIQQCD
ncbi:uncharacterized protein Z518_07675 [Rhinocladiella mackenziei CBS 650.93]|uniref:BTB domain-containing protein n=1 Tax=Rhinocladiella mackenziei CBS 650.93 TaxID=1442369 RepID=A0A0D2FPK1_9EURO|nr:uncharacterized protein Z518_07675 [Rhinocladiella mackenziei CBS 650.93]KIX04122.1 hypothetical protein Z518_07675 [Rhinocladiella mackenziei CBS 650.93]